VRDEGVLPEAGRDRAVISPDGWLARATSGCSTKTATLRDDRKKDMFKTAAGKFVAPQPI